MPFEISWYREDSIILVKINKEERTSTLSDDAARIRALVEASTQSTVHIMMDLTDAQGGSPNVKGNARELASAFKHPRVGWAVTYGNNSPLIKFLTQMITQILGVRSHIVNTETEAITFLEAYDSGFNVRKTDEAQRGN